MSIIRKGSQILRTTKYDFQLIQKAKEQSLSGDEMKALSKLAKSNKQIRKMLPDVYGEMRGSEIRLTQNILKKLQQSVEKPISLNKYSGTCL